MRPQVPKVAAHRGCATRDRRRGEAGGAHVGDPALELLDGGVADGTAAEGRERRQVSPIGVDRARGAAGGQVEEEAIDVGVESGHGAGSDSARCRSLLSQERG